MSLLVERTGKRAAASPFEAAVHSPLAEPMLVHGSTTDDNAASGAITSPKAPGSGVKQREVPSGAPQKSGAHATATVLHHEGLLLLILSQFPDLADRLRLSLVSKAWLRALLQDIALPASPGAVRSLPALVRLAGGCLRTLDISQPCVDYYAAGLTGAKLLQALPGGGGAAGSLKSLIMLPEEPGFSKSHGDDLSGRLSLRPDHIAQLAGRCPGLQQGSSRLLISCGSPEDMSRLSSALSAIPGRHIVSLALVATGRAAQLEALRAALEQAAGHPNLAGFAASCSFDRESAPLFLPLLRAAPQGGRRGLTVFQLSVLYAAPQVSIAALFDALGTCESVETVLLKTDLYLSARAPAADIQALSLALRARAGALRHLSLSDVAYRALLQPGTALNSLAEASLPHLQSLALSGCGLNRLALSGVAAALVAAPQLRRADLSKNPLFPSVNGSVRAFARALSEHCPRLESLSLEATFLGRKCTMLLASALAARRTPLRELRVGGNLIRAAGAAALISASRVEALHAQQCGLLDKGVAAAGFALAANCTLRELDLSMNDCAGDKGPERFFAELARNTTLTHLVWVNPFPSDFSHIPGSIGANNRGNGDGEAEESDDGVLMHPVSEYREQWGEPVAEALSQMLQVNSTLQRLHLVPGSMYDEGGFVEKISKGLALNAGLLTLELHDCTDPDLEALGLALRKNTTLRRLSVGTKQYDGDDGMWTDSGAVSFASIVGGSSNKTLRHLAFGGAREFTRVGALALATILLGTNEHLVLHLVASLVHDGNDEDGFLDEMSTTFAAMPKGLRQRVIGDVSGPPS